MKIIVTVLIVLLASCSDRGLPEPENQMVRTAKIFKVEAAQPHIEFELVGRAEAVQTVDLSFQVGGPLEKLPVLEGQVISKGDLIASLEPREFDLAVREARAQLKLASQDLKRKQQVFAEKGIAKSAVEDAETIFELREVQLEKALEALKDSSLTAPFDAYVGQRYIDNFTNVRPLEPVVRLYDLSEVLIVASVPEQILATVQPEQIIEIIGEFPFLPQPVPLTYRENRGDADALAQTYGVSFAMNNQAGTTILPGMTAKVRVKLKDPERQSAATYIPATSVVADPSNKLFVWVFNAADSSVEQRFIEAGVPSGELVPVIAGLQPGDEIVGAGASQLTANMKVTPYQRRNHD